MKRRNYWLAMTLTVAGLALCTSPLVAQQPPDRGERGRRGFDPEEWRQRMMERVKEQLEVTQDDEWKVIEPLVQKVFDARRDAMALNVGGMMRGFARGPRPGGEPGPGRDEGRDRRPGFFGESSPEVQALEKAIDSKASKDELKSAMAKYRAAKKAKDTQLQQAQENLRKVLTVRQEAIAVLNGWLD